MQRIKPYMVFAIICVLFVVSYYPSLISIVHKWSSSDDYTHAFFTVPIVIYMIWLKRDLLIRGESRPVVGFILIAFSTCIYVVSLKLQIPTIIFLATVFTIISVLIYFGGFRILKDMIIPVLLLFMIIPIPNQLLSVVTASLQLKISHASEIIVQMFSVPLYREGNVLHIPDKTFQVIEACSGIRSLISMTTLSLILGYFTLDRTVSVIMLLVFSIPVAIIVNIIRVVVLVLAYHYFAFDISSGAPHTVMGVVLFIIGLFLLFSFQRILAFWENKN